MNPRKIVDILLVEDSLDDADLTTRALKKHNLHNNLHHVEDGVEALEFIFAPDGLNMPKLILLDVKMPRLNGIEVLRKLKNDPRTRSIPVVMLTSSKEEPDIKECYAIGVNSYIVKPVEFESFMKAISDLGVYWLFLNQNSK
ncbi:MAG TPA: response regulator [Cytophagales bacterium]|nr:response regulator [Cytophagales bacterium]